MSRRCFRKWGNIVTTQRLDTQSGTATSRDGDVRQRRDSCQKGLGSFLLAPDLGAHIPQGVDGDDDVVVQVVGNLKVAQQHLPHRPSAALQRMESSSAARSHMQHCTARHLQTFQELRTVTGNCLTKGEGTAARPSSA